METKTENNLRYMTGIIWVIISIIRTYTVGLKSLVVWLATFTIWLYIIDLNLRPLEARKK